MDSISVFVWIVIAILLFYLLFQTRFGSWLFGIEYFEEKYTFQKPMSAELIKELFTSIQLKQQYPKDVLFHINSRHFYSISYKGMEQWTSWIPLGEMPDKSFEDFETRFRDAWSIVIHGHDLHCAVYNNDSTLLYTDKEFREIRLVGLGIVKFPWNVWKIKKERQFLSQISACLKELEQEYLQ